MGRLSYNYRVRLSYGYMYILLQQQISDDTLLKGARLIV
jgi:hypothetical protein